MKTKILIACCLVISLTSVSTAETSWARLARKVNEKFTPNHRTPTAQPKVPATQQPPAPVVAARTTGMSKAQVDAQNAAVNRRIQGLQTALEQEEKRLRQSMTQFNAQREAALKKNDTAALKKIENLEASLIKSYEQRVEALVGSMEKVAATPPKQPVARKAPQQARQQQQPAPKRGFRLFGLGR